MNPHDVAKGLALKIVQQDGTIQQMYIRDTAHNRQLSDYIARHESFATSRAILQEQSNDRS